ncbi:hypothetical protein HDV01_004636 [Terramyces sp. JEL0728]|nr:hypothetical protein HDV01_004636 [Terramyces sp. JEL0728]
MIFALLIAVARSQDCSLTNFQPCLDIIENYKETTCAMIQTSSPTYYNQCLCYQMYHQSLCYQQCPGNVTVQQDLENNVVPEMNSLCASVGLNALNLPVPPAWQVFFQQTHTITAKAGSPNSASAATSATSTPTAIVQQVKNSASEYSYALGPFIALLGYFA